MGALEGRVAIITGAGRGIGREHALLFAAEGAKVVVNDLGCAVNGSGDDRTAAQRVVDEIKQMGGDAIANTDDVADWDGGHHVVSAAIEAFGDLHMLVNNAGIIRDRVLVNMTEEEWDLVMHVDVNGHFVPTRWAATYWREQSKAGRKLSAAVVNTSSTSGLLGNPGQSNYGTAKAGIAAFTVIAAQEALALRRARQCDRAGSQVTDHRVDPRSVRHCAATSRLRRVRFLGPRERLAHRRLSRERSLLFHREGLLCPRRQGAVLPALDPRSRDRQG